MPLLAADYEFLRRLVRERSGIVLGDDKQYLVESRLLPLARGSGHVGIEQLCQHLRLSSTTPLLRQVVEAMTTNETLFFRDVHPFELLGRRLLPELTQKRLASRSLGIWCGACSTGQEPYSIAMTVREECPSLLGWNLRLLATDLSGEMVARSRAGVYSALEVGRGLPPALLTKWFSRIDSGSWQVREELRRMVEFREMNLLDTWNIPGPIDIVFLRNVLIYFDLETKKAILGKVRRLLAPDGYLFLGGAETTMNIDDAFERLPDAKGGAYRIRR